MTAFDRAWGLLKAPLDLSSVREFDRDAVTYDKVMGDFIHPETGEIWPMTVTTPSLSHDFNIDIDYPEGQEPVFDDEIGRKAANAWVGYHDEEEREREWWRSDLDKPKHPPPNTPLEVHPAVAEHLRRLGMGTAMYDLITALGHNVFSSGHLTDKGDHLWVSNQGKRGSDAMRFGSGNRWRGLAERERDVKG